MGINCCDICELDECSDGNGNPINLDSPLAACSYDNEHEYKIVLEKLKKDGMKI